MWLDACAQVGIACAQLSLLVDPEPRADPLTGLLHGMSGVMRRVLDIVACILHDLLGVAAGLREKGLSLANGMIPVNIFDGAAKTDPTLAVIAGIDLNAALALVRIHMGLALRFVITAVSALCEGSASGQQRPGQRGRNQQIFHDFASPRSGAPQKLRFACLAQDTKPLETVCSSLEIGSLPPLRTPAL
jgi:hypothetical protein